MRLLSNIPHSTSTHGDVVVRAYAYDMQWDEAGRLKYDETHGIVQMRYSTLGKLTQLRKSSGNLQTISYDGLGRKTSVVYTRPDSPTADRRDYYASGLTTHADSVETIRFPGGYFDAALKPHYYATDYQGNNIGVFDSRGYAVQTMQYYPYGEPVRRPTGTFSSSENRYLFGDKEYSDAFGEALYDQEARSYSPAVIPIFTQPDAHAESRPWDSPLIYARANPIMFNDPTGNNAEVTVEDSTITVSVAIVLTGDAATSELAKIYQKKIDDVWGSIDSYNYKGQKYSVYWNVSVEPVNQFCFTFKKYKYTNYMKPFMGINSRGDTTSHVSNYWTGELRAYGRNDQTLEKDNPMAHEFGHLLGLEDRYYKDVIYSGWKGDVMAESTDKDVFVSKRHIEALFDEVIELSKVPNFTILFTPNWTVNSATIIYNINRLPNEI